MRSKRLWVPLLLVLASVALPGSEAAAQQSAFRVVVHPDTPVSSLSVDEVSRLFFRRTTRWEDGTRAQPVDQPPGSGTRESFSRAVLGRSTSAMVAYWQQQIFSGRGVPPPELSGDREILEFVAARPGAVGYVSPGIPLEGVKAVEVLP